MDRRVRRRLSRRSDPQRAEKHASGRINRRALPAKPLRPLATRTGEKVGLNRQIPLAWQAGFCYNAGCIKGDRKWFSNKLKGGGHACLEFSLDSNRRYSSVRTSVLQLDCCRSTGVYRGLHGYREWLPRCTPPAAGTACELIQGCPPSPGCGN